MHKLIGTWNLVEWDCTLDGVYHNHPFGEDARGRLMYSAENTMMAILMRAQRPTFEIASLSQGTIEEKTAAVDGYVSYSGTYRTDGEQVIHTVQFSLLPNWIGTDLVRLMRWTDAGELVLTTLPQLTRSGRAVVNRLRWEKV